MPGELLVRDPVDQHLRGGSGGGRARQVSGATRSGEADHRGGQPGRGFLMAGKEVEDALRGSQRGRAQVIAASGQGDGGGDQQRLKLTRGHTVRHAPELAGQGPAAPGLDDFPDGQPVDGHAGGQLPVAGLGGVPYRVSERAVPLEPPGGPVMQGGYTLRVFAPQLETQYLREQRVVPVPPVPGRLHERVRVGHLPQDPRRVFLAGHFGGDVVADTFQDACPQQQVPDLGRLGIERLIHQISGHGAVLGDQLLDELVRIGMGGHRDRGEADAGRPALRPLGKALQRVRGQLDAMLSHEQAGFGDAEGQVAEPDVGQPQASR